MATVFRTIFWRDRAAPFSKLRSKCLSVPRLCEALYNRCFNTWNSLFLSKLFLYSERIILLQIREVMFIFLLLNSDLDSAGELWNFFERFGHTIPFALSGKCFPISLLMETSLLPTNGSISKIFICPFLLETGTYLIRTWPGSATASILPSRTTITVVVRLDLKMVHNHGQDAYK